MKFGPKSCKSTRKKEKTNKINTWNFKKVDMCISDRNSSDCIKFGGHFGSNGDVFFIRNINAFLEKNVFFNS